MCLFYVSDPTSSDAADSYCNSKYQGDTIAIPNAFENKAISEYLKQQISDSNQLVWLGAYADNWSCCFGAEHGIKWFWYDYNIDFGYTNFASTENGDAIIGYGVAVNPSTGYWYMKNTTIQLPFLCKALMKH
uniref:C-type lectin domain-containing protein n=1 Tax=Acrobeloides nanus TaxID=290746 RepID=A0A914D7R4_9BILA